jgi:phenylacetate-CoA ligase
MRLQKAFVETVGKRVESVLGVGVIVKLVEPNSITRHEGKAERVIDRRVR